MDDTISDEEVEDEFEIAPLLVTDIAKKVKDIYTGTDYYYIYIYIDVFTYIYIYIYNVQRGRRVLRSNGRRRRKGN